MLHEDTSRDIIQPSFSSSTLDDFPIRTATSINWFSSKLELRSGNSGVFFPDIFVRGRRPTGLGVAGGSEYLLDAGPSSLIGADGKKLPVEVVGVMASFKLSSYKGYSSGQILKKVFMWNS